MAINYSERAAHGMRSLEHSGRMEPGGFSPRYTRSLDNGRKITIVDVHGAMDPKRMNGSFLKPADPTKSASRF